MKKIDFNALTRREWQIMARLVRGNRVTVIAGEMQLAPSTISTYRRRILRKLGLRTFPELVIAAYRRGVVPRRQP